MLRDHSRNDPHLSILCRCSPFYQNSALYPIIARMQQVLQFNKDESAAAKLAKLTQSLEPVAMHGEETVGIRAGAEVDRHLGKRRRAEALDLDQIIRGRLTIVRHKRLILRTTRLQTIFLLK